MACSRLVFLTLVLSVVSSYAVPVPVFLWGDLSKTGIKANPLSKVSSEEFRVTLKGELSNDPFTVIFIEETLSVEDFSRKNGEGETAFPYLYENLGESVYLPSVESALHVLNKLADPEKVDHVKLTENGNSADIIPESGKFLFINLKDAREGESRADLLRRHNDFMEDMYSKLQERYDSVVGVYTAHYPSWTVPTTHSRVRRQANTNGTASITLSTQDYVLEGLRLYAEGITYGDAGTIVTLDGKTGSSTEFNETVMNTTVQYPSLSLTLNFKLKSSYWFFDSVTVTKDSVSMELPATEEVYAIEGFSYRCGERILFARPNETEYNVTFIDLKVQPFFANLNESQMEFGDSFNCVGFFSVPIWAGLFVTFILLSITFYGIMMMMDIRTMDRFDDPKGKTITINASE